MIYDKSKKYPPKQLTIPELFIIESLGQDDLDHNRLEGLALVSALRLAGKSARYIYIRNETELQPAIDLFRLSQCRYLHFSGHGNKGSIGLQEATLSYSEFAKYFENHLTNRRLFISACESGDVALANEIIKLNKGIQSIVAPVDSVNFDIALAFWTSLYIAIFDKDPDSVKHNIIAEKVLGLSKVFNEKFYIGFYNSVNVNWTHTVT